MAVGGWLRAPWRRLRRTLRRARRDRLEVVPRHVAIIMDGNGRWARRRHLPVLVGHREGTRALKRAVRAAIEAGVRQLTVYSFSTENWSRPEDEVSGLMRLLEEMIDAEVPELDAQGVKVVFVGRREGIDAKLLEKIEQAERQTAGNRRLVLHVAFNYGGRAEIVDAVKRIMAAELPADEVTENDITRNLYVPDMLEPDLIIRTSGEMRLSNFLLWESAYSEMYFSDVLWPDFDEEAFAEALREYARRERRFGRRDGSDETGPDR